MGKSRLFNWRDLRRIAKSTFNDTPENDKEIIAWSSTVLYLCTSVKTILRQIEHHLRDSLFYDGVLQMIQSSLQELLAALELFSDYRLNQILNWIYENVIIANMGYIKILEDKEIKDSGKD